jgi:hypothetical protein
MHMTALLPVSKLYRNKIYILKEYRYVVWKIIPQEKSENNQEESEAVNRGRTENTIEKR